tara:strand:+ start:134 stop:466 length:333 start_codon:yes stop_codon:yes gene_type:complete
MRKKTVDQIAKENKDKDYHHERVLSGDPNSNNYNVAISGKKGNERYSKSLVKKNKKLRRTTTRTIKSKDGKQVSVNKIEGTDLGKGKYHISSDHSIKRKRTTSNLKIKKK